MDDDVDEMMRCVNALEVSSYVFDYYYTPLNTPWAEDYIRTLYKNVCTQFHLAQDPDNHRFQKSIRANALLQLRIAEAQFMLYSLVDRDCKFVEERADAILAAYALIPLDRIVLDFWKS